MNHWAKMLAELPALGQRLIARTQRISLPRKASAEVRIERLRAALCRSAAVRATYFALDPEAQSALQELRALRGGLSADELAARFGPLRSWSQLAADPKPRSIAEHLVLRGWLLHRPATPQHPAHYLLPPELRRWLPTPLAPPTFGIAPAPSPAPIVAVAVATLRLAQEQPLALAQYRRLAEPSLPTAATVRHIAARLDGAPPDLAPLLASLLPVLIGAGLLASHEGAATLTPGGQCFLARTPAEQWDALHHTWQNLPAPEPAIAALLPNARGIDWPLLRRRLLAWAAALPPNVLLDPASLFGSLTAALGPLADAWTHGFRPVDRAPWQPRRAAAVWEAALHGPLTWLGFVSWHSAPDGNTRCAYRLTPAAFLPATPTPPPPDAPKATVELRAAVVVLAEPAVLAEAAQSRSVQRHLGERIAPGVALVEPAHLDALTRALERQGIAAPPPASHTAAPPTLAKTTLMPGDCAALLVACACYQRHGPEALPLLVSEALQRELWAALSPALRKSTQEAIATIVPPPVSSQPTLPPIERLTPAAALVQVRAALQRRGALTMRYDRGGVGDWSERTVRPLELWQRNGLWYLRAYCLLDNAERTFRVDRIGSIAPPASANHDRDRLGAHQPNPQDFDAPHAWRVEPVQPHAVGVGVN